MNNLLRTLTESHVKSAFPGTDLKLLLTTVKDGRRHSYDNKLSDPFYDSLEGLLHDLRTITIDNHDAEAFLKPVARAEVPDYYDVISNPMDLQTMLKKVKQKQYKSKREFKDDLDLIWSNCYTYNATENHPLRICVNRLKVKAEKLLENITDRKERTDPPIPSNLAVTNVSKLKVNGFISVNGHAHRSPSIPNTMKTSTPPTKPSTPTPFKKPIRRNVPFPDSPAIIRTQSGMSTFQHLDHEMAAALNPAQSTHNSVLPLTAKLKELSTSLEYESDPESLEESTSTTDREVGEKRKLNGIVDRPRKRARTALRTDDLDIVDLWWGAVQSETIIGNELPDIALSSSLTRPLQKPKQSSKRKRRKKVPKASKSLLSLINNNIRTMKRMRSTHAKFAALNINNNNNSGGNDESGEGGATEFPGTGLGFGEVEREEEVTALDDDRVDERPWKPKGRAKGIEIGEESAGDCVKWMSSKVLEHAGFQGSSQVALDVIAGVTSEYLLNVGRTIRFLCDKYSNTMSAEEIILHTLFESGTTKIQDLERYISDDVERYGTRLGELEKKLTGAYREAIIVDDDDLFAEDENEEDGAFVMGNFADAIGDDFLGLRELGIAAEFGMTSLSIPKKLLKGKSKGENKLSSSAAKPTEPPLPFPLPPAFIPLNSAKVEDQIGLLKPYYQNRLSAILVSAPTIPAIPPAAPPPFGFNPSAPNAQAIKTDEDVKPPVHILVLPDDPPNPSQVKMGPLGQIIKVGLAANAAKKKSKATVGVKSEAGVPVPGGGPGGVPDAPPKKKKGATGVGTGNGRKKKALEQAQAQAQAQGLSLPPVVVASA